MTRPSLSTALRNKYADRAARPQGTPTTRVASALETVTGARARLRQLLVDHTAADSAIQSAIRADKSLTAEGKRAALQQRRAELAEQTAAALAALRSEVDTARETINTRAAAHLPKPATGVEPLLARQAAWARSRSLLESGVDIRTLITETDDPELLHSLREEAAVWLRARGDAAAAAQVRHRVDLQLARVTGATAEADMLAAHHADGAFAAFTTMADQATNTVAGAGRIGDGLTAAVNARLTEMDRDDYWRAIESDDDVPDDAA